MDIIAFFPIPKQLKKLLPTNSPDLDNIVKSVCDALNGIAYFDDSQICKLSIHKYYAKVQLGYITFQVIDTKPSITFYFYNKILGGFSFKAEIQMNI